MFSDNYIFFCAQKKKAVTTAAEEMGFSRSAGQKWADGSAIPHKSTLATIANYFDCTVEDLLKEKPRPLIRDAERKEWIVAWENATPEAREAAMAVLKLGVQQPEDQD